MKKKICDTCKWGDKSNNCPCANCSRGGWLHLPLKDYWEDYDV